QTSQLTQQEIPLSQLITDVRKGEIEKLLVEGDKLTVTYKDGSKATSRKEASESLVKTFETEKIPLTSIQLEIKDQAGSQLWWNFLLNGLPIILMILLFVFIFRQARGASDSLFSFGQSRARLFNPAMSRVTFADVAGEDEAKKELEEIVEFLKTPQKFQALGARTPKGVLLIGPAGCGKTLLARAVAGEAHVPFFSIAGSEFMEMLVGVGASRVRDLFSTAKKTAPSIIFIDEMDAIGRQRGMGIAGGHDEREQTLNQILVEMDGFEPSDNVIVIAATNRPDILDPALTRPGRFDRTVLLDLPDIEGRKGILKVHMRGKRFSEHVDLDKIARRTVGFSGADLANMLNEAAILAARQNKKQIDADDLEEAATKIKLGPEKKRMQSDQDKKMTAYHEGGHALVSHLLPHMDPVHRISIVSRGLSLGFTMIPPAIDRYNETKTRLLEQITALLGGRASEETVFQEFSVGAANDIEKATNVARHMVVEYGMSELGPISLGSRGGMQFLSDEWLEPTRYSQEMAARIDSEIKQILDACYQRAKALISGYREVLDAIADSLMKNETLDGDQFEELVEKASKGKVKPKIKEKQFTNGETA
ncbi:MAG TPA: ATP-dependent zinc metalloprotease FtsH, partial [Patescibacteria group bacterium]|nr:ATP-dependent zinc metalloprotease FtsH [Patescibacteria group bacterium]